MDNREIKTYDPDHPGLVRLSGRLYGTISYVEHFDIYVLDYGDNVLYNEKENRYQDGFRWKKNKFKSYDDCLNFCREHDIKIVDKYKVKSPFSNGLPDPRFLSKRTTPYSPDELVDISMLEENKQNKKNNMKKRIRLTESDLKNMVKQTVKKILREYRSDNTYGYHLAELEGERADYLYDLISHNEISIDDAVEYVLDKNPTFAGNTNWEDYKERIVGHIYGEDKKGRILSYDEFAGIFDVWVSEEKANS